MTKYKSGDKVKYRDNDDRVFTIYQVYNDKVVSLCLSGYNDVEQNYITKTSEIYKVKK